MVLTVFNLWFSKWIILVISKFMGIYSMIRMFYGLRISFLSGSSNQVALKGKALFCLSLLFFFNLVFTSNPKQSGRRASKIRKWSFLLFSKNFSHNFGKLGKLGLRKKVLLNICEWNKYIFKFWSIINSGRSGLEDMEADDDSDRDREVETFVSGQTWGNLMMTMISKIKSFIFIIKVS